MYKPKRRRVQPLLRSARVTCMESCQPLTLSLNIPGLLLEVTTQRGIPTMFDAEFYVESGGLASYGPDMYESGRNRHDW